MIGVLGGTFDPIHFGHLRPALEVHERIGLDELRVVPCGEPPHRSAPRACAAHRFAMVELALTGVPDFRVDPRELQRPGPSYTVDTLTELRAELGPARSLVLLLGMDAFAGLHTWHQWGEIPRLAHLAVMHRPGAAPPTDPALLHAFRPAGSPASLRESPAGCIHFQAVTQMDISATAIRDGFAAGRSARFLLPDAVCHYIERHRLYEPHPETPIDA